MTGQAMNEPATPAFWHVSWSALLPYSRRGQVLVAIRLARSAGACRICGDHAELFHRRELVLVAQYHLVHRVRCCRYDLHHAKREHHVVLARRDSFRPVVLCSLPRCRWALSAR